MDELVVNRHSFSVKTKKVGDLISERGGAEVSLPTLKEKTFIFSNHVTAKEMNTFTVELQGILKASNTALTGALKEIKGIYNALDVLDKDYIDGIV